MRKVIILLLTTSMFAQVSVKGSVAIKGSVTVTGSSGSVPILAQNTAVLLGTSSNFTQTPSICTSGSQYNGAGGPCPVSITGTWTSAAYSQVQHCFFLISVGGHDTTYDSKGFQECISTAGGVLTGTANVLQINGASEQPTNPFCSAGSASAPTNYIYPYAGTTLQCTNLEIHNCVPTAPNYNNCHRGPFHTYAGVAWIPQNAINVYGITGDAVYQYSGYGPPTPAIGEPDTWLWGLNGADASYGTNVYLTSTMTVSGGTEHAGSDNIADWGETAGHMFVMDPGGSNIQIWEHDINAKTKTRIADFGDSGADTGYMGVIDQATNEFLIYSWHNTSTRKLYKVNLSTGAHTDITSLFSGCSFFTMSETQAGDLKYPGMAWNPDKGVIGILGTETGNTIWEIKPDGTCNPITITGATIPQSTSTTYMANGVYQRLAYDRSLKMYVYIPTQPNLQSVAICTTVGGCFVPNNFASRIAGTNVPGGASSLIQSSSDPTTSLWPDSMDSSLPLSTTNGGRGVCKNGGSCNVAYEFSVDSSFALDGSSAKATAPSTITFPDISGPYFNNFSAGPNYPTQFGQGQEFFWQFAFAPDANLLNVSNWTGSGGFKISIASEGDRTGYIAGSHAVDMETVLNQNAGTTGCGPNTLKLYIDVAGTSTQLQWATTGADFLDMVDTGGPHYGGRGVPVTTSRCPTMTASQFSVYQYHIKVGTWCTNSSTVDIWIQTPGQPEQLVWSVPDWNYCPSDTVNSKFGKMWNTNYSTGTTGASATGHGWWDDEIAATRKIPPANTATPNAPDSLTLTDIGSGHVRVDWRVNSANGTAQDDTGFAVERCTGTAVACLTSQSFTQIGTTSAGASTYTDNTSSSSVTYSYRVRPFNGYGYGAYAAPICYNTLSGTCGMMITPA